MNQVEQFVQEYIETEAPSLTEIVEAASEFHEEMDRLASAHEAPVRSALEDMLIVGEEGGGRWRNYRMTGASKPAKLLASIQ